MEIIDDDFLEGEEFFRMNIDSVSAGGMIGERNTTRVFIRDNDGMISLH